MGWNVKVSKGDGDGKPREVCEPDQYPGVLVALIDLGTHSEKAYQSQEMVDKHSVAVVWEAIGPKTSTGEPFYFAEKFGLSLHEKATFRKVLEAGGVIIPEDLDTFDVASALGKFYLLEVEVGQSAKGNSYSRLAKKGGWAKLPKAMAKLVSPPTRDVLIWQIEQGVMPKHDWLPYLYGKSLDEHQKASHEVSGKKAVAAGAGAGYSSEDEEAAF
jgi:hypothetical protein